MHGQRVQWAKVLVIQHGNLRTTLELSKGKNGLHTVILWTKQIDRHTNTHTHTHMLFYFISVI